MTTQNAILLTTVNVLGKTRSINWKNLAEINEFDIQEILKRHPEFLGYLGNLRMHKKHEVRVATRDLEETKANIYLRYKGSGRKITEKQCDFYVLSSPEYKKQRRILEEHERDYDLLTMLYDMLKDKKDMLVQVSSNMKIDKKMAFNWEKRVQAMEIQLRKLIKNDNS